MADRAISDLMTKMNAADRERALLNDKKQRGGDNGGNGGGPPMSDVERRVSVMEEEVRAIGKDLAAIKSNYSTKSDLASTETSIQKIINAQTWRMITAMGIMTAVFTAVVKWVM